MKLSNLKNSAFTLPPTYDKRKGYHVLFYHPSNGYWGGEGWIPLSSCYGYPYEYKGFAINKAKGMAEKKFYNDAFIKVVDISTDEVVWKCDNCKEVEGGV